MGWRLSTSHSATTHLGQRGVPPVPFRWHSESLELPFILSVWSRQESTGHMLAGWVLKQLEQTPSIPDEIFAHYGPMPH